MLEVQPVPDAYGSRRALDRRAAGAWEADWALVEPRWSGRSDRPGTGGR
ncbi:hypothetical protein [Kitasatospora sp. NPDC051914]